jgi:hypothetical protein
VFAFLVELSELRELWLIGAEMMEGWEGWGEKEEKRRKCVNFSPNISPHRAYEIIFYEYLFF